MQARLRIQSYHLCGDGAQAGIHEGNEQAHTASGLTAAMHHLIAGFNGLHNGACGSEPSVLLVIAGALQLLEQCQEAYGGIGTANEISRASTWIGLAEN